MAIMANITPIEIKPNTSSQTSTSKKNNSSSNKSGVDFGKVLNNQSNKSEKEDVSTKTDSTTAQLISGMMGLNAQVNAVPIQNNENLIAELPVDDVGGQLGNANQLTELIGKNVIRLDVATGMNTSQKQLAALLTKGTDVNMAAGNTDAKQFTMQLQEVLQNKQLAEQTQISDSSSNKISATTNNALLEAVPSFALVNSNAAGKTNTMPQADNKKTTPTQTGSATLDSTQLLDSVDAKPVTTSPLLTNVVSAVENESESGTMLLGGKKQLSVESLLPNQTTNTTETFAGALNQQTMKNEGQVAVSDGKQVAQQPVKDSYHVASQIVDQARLISGQKNTEMIIQLKPEHLGELTLKVTVESGVVSASFHSNNSEVRNIIEASLPQLKQELSNQGLKIENVDVYAGLGDFFSNGHHESRQKPEVKVQNKKIEEDFLDALDDSTSIVESTSESGVDYRI